ncbi:MAG: AsmA-like C-terminal region-containing protein [Candidatus Gastranaerophilales bacterium]|nr:AsmA-like C-terminal region-containing protein [Candidatus Gastranaerophilales bacterium]
MISKRKRFFIKFLSIIVVLFGIMTALIWYINTVSSNTALVSQLITSQISQLLDLDSYVENPRAYVDWDLQYKIKADKLVFKNPDGTDLVSGDNIELNIFVPAFAFKKIYITQINTKNLYVDFVRDKNNKINIIEIFNIKGFFDIYFKNSHISVDKYIVKFTDEYKNAEEHMLITGDSIVLSKFSLNKYMQLIMDGIVSYKKHKMPFFINYNTKLPVQDKKYNVEVSFQDMNFQDYIGYIQEFNPKIKVFGGSGNLKLKVSSNKYFNVQSEIKDFTLSTEEHDNWLDFPSELKLESKGALSPNDIIIDDFKLFSTDFEMGMKGSVKDLKAANPGIKIDAYIKEGSQASSIIKLFPSDFNFMKGMIGKAIKHKVRADTSGELKIRGGEINGGVLLDNLTFNDVYGLPKSSLLLDFRKDKLYLDGKIFATKNNTVDKVMVTGYVKFLNGIFNDINVISTANIKLSDVVPILNVISDLIPFPTGPVPDMNIKHAMGEITLNIKGSPPDVLLNGILNFRNATVAYPGFYGFIENGYGRLNFAGDRILYEDIKGQVEGVRATAFGETLTHQNGLTSFQIDVLNTPLNKAKIFIDGSEMLTHVSQGLKILKNPQGYGSTSINIQAQKNSDIPYVKGKVNIHSASGEIEGLYYPAVNVSGSVNFDSNIARLDLKGIINGLDTRLSGTIEKDYGKLKIQSANVDVKKAQDIIFKSPILAEARNAFEEINLIDGLVSLDLMLNGSFKDNNLQYFADIGLKSVTLNYLDITAPLVLNKGQINAQQNNIFFDKVEGSIFESPVYLDGVISNINQANEYTDLRFEVNNFNVSSIKYIVCSTLLTPEFSKALSNYDYLDGFISINAHIKNKVTAISLDFDNLYAIYCPSKDDVLLKSGRLFFDGSKVVLKDLDAQISKSTFLVDGTITDFSSNPFYDLTIASNIVGEDFNKTFSKILNIPVELAGNLYLHTRLKGNMENWNVKLRSMLDENSNIFYKGADLGKDISRFIFADLSGTRNDLIINKFNIFSPPKTSNQSHPANQDIMLEAKGKIYNANSTAPSFENLNIEALQYINISVLNALIKSSDNTAPFLSEGEIKGSVIVNGKAETPLIEGEVEAKDAIIPSLNTNIKSAKVQFLKDSIEIDSPEISIATSKAAVKATLNNKLDMPLVVKNAEIISESINYDEIKNTFESINIGNTEDENIVGTSLPPIIVEKGTIKAKEFIYSGLLATDASADFKVTPDWFCIISNLDTAVTEGKLTGDLIYNIYTSDLRGNIKAENILANAFATTFFNLPNEIYGDLSGTFNFSTRGTDHEQITKNINGVASFNLASGRMIRLGSIEYMLRLANIFKGGIFRFNLNALLNIFAPKTGYFDTIKGDLQIEDGVIISDNILSDSPDLKLFMAGSYNMNNSIVNATIIGQMPKDANQGKIALGSIGKISINSLTSKLVKAFESEESQDVSFNPFTYLRSIPGLNIDKSDYRFFVVTLNGNLYTDKYVKDFKWIKAN